MICEYCGAPMDEGTVFCTQCGAVHSQARAPVSVSTQTSQPKPEPIPVPAPEAQPPMRKKNLHPALRVLLSLCTVLLCIALSVSLVATALVLDLQRLTSENGVAALVDDMLWEKPALPVPGRTYASFAGTAMEISAPDLSDADGLVGLVYDALKEQYGSEMTVTQSQLETFVEESTAKDYVAEKLASYVDDLASGTRNTTIENDEILDLIDDNLDLVEDIFEVQVDRHLLADVEEFLNQYDINDLIQENVLDPIADAEIPGLAPLLNALTGFTGRTATVEDLMIQLRAVTSAQNVAAMLLLDLLLVVLLVLTNRLRVGSALVSAGVPALIVGLLLSLPVALIQLLPMMLGDSLGLATLVVDLICALVGRIAPVHYGMAIVGLVLIVAGAIIKAVTKKQKAPLS